MLASVRLCQFFDAIDTPLFFMSKTSTTIIRKLPEITVAFWMMKICATTLGETAGDLFSMTMHIGYGMSSVLLLFFFIVVLILQLLSKKYSPALYWMVILATSTAGTTLSDYMDRTLGLGYLAGSSILVLLLIVTLTIWKAIEKTLSVEKVHTRRAEGFYWTTILFSNTLGTAFGDFLADDSGFGFFGSALLISGVLLLIVFLYYYTAVSRVFLFWGAFVLTRPLGATVGDFLTKPVAKGGMNLGTIGSSAILFLVLLILVLVSIYKIHKLNKQSISAKIQY